jgi:Family of unknown function (DUF6286)
MTEPRPAGPPSPRPPDAEPGSSGGAATGTLPPLERETPVPAGGHPGRRFWSPRRVPSAVVALIGLVASVALLYDTISVRAGEPAQRWRREIADQFATRHLDDGWVIGGAALAAVIGLWLIWLALTPGLRAVLPMRTASPDMRAGVDRRAAALVLRDSALQTSGVSSARVKVGRKKVKARATVHFRELDEVRDELRETLQENLDGLALGRPPQLELSVRTGSGR